MRLEPHEAKSLLWLKIKTHMQAELATMRLRNDNPLDAIDTAKLRGRLAQTKEFLLLDTPGETAPNDE